MSAATSSPTKSTSRLAGRPRQSSAARKITGSGFRQPTSSEIATHPVSPSSPRDLIVMCCPDVGPLVTMPHGTPAALRSCSNATTSGSCGSTERDVRRYHSASSSCESPMPGHSSSVRRDQPFPARQASFVERSELRGGVLGGRGGAHSRERSRATAAPSHGWRRHGPRACCRDRRARRCREASGFSLAFR